MTKVIPLVFFLTRSICQHKLLRSGQLESSTMSRTYPPTILEWRSNKKRVNMALPAVCCDADPSGGQRTYHASVDSYSTCEEFASAILHVRPRLAILLPHFHDKTCMIFLVSMHRTFRAKWEKIFSRFQG